jgi:hypothetical protein
MSAYRLSLSPALAARLDAELTPDERLVWTGQPRPDLAIRPAYCLAPFGLVFAGIAACWMVAATAIGITPFALCGLPFIAVGGLFALSPLWLRRRAEQTLYALTNRRALVLEPSLWGPGVVRSYTAAGLGKMFRRERADGSGDLVFDEYTTRTTDSEGMVSTATHWRGFLAVSDVRTVEDLVRRTLLDNPHGTGR